MSESLEHLLAELLAKGEAAAAPPEPPSTRGRIVRAALDLFAERSYEAATTRAIADRAGVTERTLFKHFPSKEQLFAQTVFPVMLRLLSPITIDSLKRILEGHNGDFRATLTALVAERIGFATRHISLVQIVAREVLTRPTFRAAAGEFFTTQMKPHVAALLAHARETGQMRDVPDELALRTIVGQVAAYVITRSLMAPDRAWDDAREAEAIVETILFGLSGPTSAGGS